MGQRSQIYVTWKNQNGENILVARYFQWNFAERMISRASALIQSLKEYLEYTYPWSEKGFYKKICRICDVNFDMCDISLSLNIIQEALDPDLGVEPKERNQHVFKFQDNNDGQLFISVDVENKKLKYGLLDYNFNSNNIMTAKQYMNWDFKDWQHSEYLDESSVKTCKENIEVIKSHAELLTSEEIEAIRNAEYKWDDLLKACSD